MFYQITKSTIIVARNAAARNIIVSRPAIASYHHSREINLPQQEAIQPATVTSVPPPPNEASFNFFPHYEADASTPPAPNESTSKPIVRVKNKSSTTVEDLVSLPAEKIREMAGCTESSFTAEPTSSLSPALQTRIVNEFEREAYAPKSSSARGVGATGLKEENFNDGRVADLSDVAAVDDRTVVQMKKEIEKMAGAGRVKSESGIPEGGVRPVHPFISGSRWSHGDR